jgi:ariadne-1
MIYKLNYVGYISAAVSQGPGCLSLRCPDPSCSAMVLKGMINKLAKDEDKNKYARFTLRAYVEGSKKVSYSHNYFEGCTCFILLMKTLRVLRSCVFLFMWLCNLSFFLQTKWCPAPDCTCAVEFISDENYDVLCNCKYGFCWNVSATASIFYYLVASIFYDHACAHSLMLVTFPVHRRRSQTNQLRDCY